MKNYVLFINNGFFAFLFLLISCSNGDEIKNDESKAPSAPLSLIISGRSSSSVILSWKKPLDEGKVKSGAGAAINFYEVKISKSEDFSNSTTKTTTKISLDVLGLDGKGVKYYFKVRAMNSAKIFGNYSDVVIDIIGSASKAVSPDKPEKILMVRGTLTGNRVVITWDAPKSAGKEKDGSPASIESYRLDYSKEQNFSSKKSISTNQELPLEAFLLGLEPTTKYYVRILAKNSGGDPSKEWSESSEVISFTTTALIATAPLPPRMVRIEEGSLKSTEVIITWDIPRSTGTKDGILAARITGYRIEYSSTSDFSSDVENIESTTTEVRLTKLLPVKNYYIRVRAINNNLEESFNTSLSAELKGGIKTPRPENAGDASPPDPVNSLEITQLGVDETQAKITWEAPLYFGRTKEGVSASLLNFVIEYSESSEFKNKIVQSVGPDNLESVIKNLKVSTTYYVRVKVRNNNQTLGLNESDDVLIEFNTLTPTPPDAPLNLVAIVPEDDLGKTQVNLTWEYSISNSVGKKGNGDDSNLIGFEVEYSSDNFANDVKSASQGLIGVSDRKASITKLSSNKSYEFRIRALNDNNFKDSDKKFEAASEYVMSEVVTTKSNESKPDSPSSVQVNFPENADEGREALVISWQAPSNSGRTPEGLDSKIVKYIVEYIKGVDGQGISFPSDATDSSINKVETINMKEKIIGLTPNTVYAFRIRAVNTNENNFSDASISLPSNTVYFSTKNLSTPPAQAQPVKSNELPSGGRSHNSVKIVWNEVTDAGKNSQGEAVGVSIQGYEVRWYPKYKPSTLDPTEVNSASPAFTLQTTQSFEKTSLNESTAYIFEIITVSDNNTDYSKRSEIKRFEVTIASKPKYAVTFDLQQGTGNNTINTQNIKEGEAALKPEMPPTKESHYFDRWVTQPDGNEAFNFNTPITQAIILYAKYVNMDDSIKAKVAPENLTGIGSTTVQGTVLASVRNNNRINRTVKEVINTYLTDANNLNDAEVNYLLRNLKTSTNVNGKFSFELGLGDPTENRESRFSIITNWGNIVTEGVDIALMPDSYIEQGSSSGDYKHSPQLTFNSSTKSISVFSTVNEGLVTAIRSFKVITNY